MLTAFGMAVARTLPRPSGVVFGAQQTNRKKERKMLFCIFSLLAISKYALSVSRYCEMNKRKDNDW